MNHRFKAAGHDVTVEHLMIMKLLFDSDGISQQQLADYFSKDKGSITRIINNMESRNLVVRIPDRSDKRIKLIYLTPFGKKHKLELFEIIHAFHEELVEDIPQKDLKLCLGVLDRILAKLILNTVDTATIK